MAKRTASRTARKAAAPTTDTPAATPPYETIPDVALQLKSAIESKSAKELQAVLRNAPIWINNRPGTPERLADSVAKLTGDASDLDLSITRIMQTEVSDTEAHVDLECQLVWSNTDTWEEHELPFELYLGLDWNDDEWQFTSVAVLPSRTPAQGPVRPETPTLDVPYFEQADPSARLQHSDKGSWETALPYFAEHDSIRPYFGGSTPGVRPYFSDQEELSRYAKGFDIAQAPVAAPSAGSTVQTEEPGYVAVYMPVLVPMTLLKQLRR